MGVAVLGPLEVDGNGSGLSPRDRVVLSALVVRTGEHARTETLADALWGEEPPTSWATVVHGCVARLRKRLGAKAIESTPAGYRLVLSESELDCRRFEHLLGRAREAMDAGDPARASYLAREALDLWRGPALSDVEEWEPGRVAAARLDGLRREAEELHADARIASGRAAEELESVRVLVAEAPFRETRWALLARALQQVGRQAESLATLRQARAVLAEQLGLDPGPELVALESQLLRQDPSLRPVTRVAASDTCPYPGLLAFDAEDTDSFFGREEDVVACLRKLREQHVLAVVGPSGVGKSSLVRAGLVAALERDGTPVVVTTPGAAPTSSLARARPTRHTVLVVDQAEEAVVVCRDGEERARYFTALAQHVADGGSLVLAMRADHLGDLAPHPDVARIVEEGLYLLGPLSEAGLRRAVEGPALRAGLRLEPGLVDLLVRDVEGEPGALPLLSHVLRETWVRREGPTLTLDGYAATGGVRGAVARSAESLYDDLDDVRRAQLRGVLLRLVVPTEGGEPVRARVSRDKLAADEGHRALVERMVAARLLSVDDGSVQIAHEALVRVWPRLRTWLDDDVEGQRVFRHLAESADAWHAMGRPASELYRGVRLARARDWRDRTQPELDEDEAAFLAASEALADVEHRAAREQVVRERAANRRLRGALATTAVLLVVSLVAVLLASRSAQRAADARDRAAGERDRASRAAVLAEASRAGAQGALTEDLTAGLLLAAQAAEVDDSAQARESLGVALTRAGALTGLHDVGRELGRPGTAYFSSASASADGTFFAACLWSDGLMVFDADTLERRPFDDRTNECSSVVFSPAGRLLAVVGATFGGATLYDLSSGPARARDLGGVPQGWGLFYEPARHVDVAFSGDGGRVAGQFHRFREEKHEFDPEGRVLVWDTADVRRPVLSLDLPAFSHVALSPDGRLLHVVLASRGSLRTYAVPSGRLLSSRDDPVVTSAAALSIAPDGETLAVATGDRVVRFSTRTLARRGPALVGHTAPVIEVVHDHRGRLLATTSDDGTIGVWDARTGARLHRFAGGDPRGIAFSADDREVLVAGGQGQVQAWDVAGAPGQLVLGEPSSATPDRDRLAVPAPDGRHVARFRGGRLRFEDTAGGAPPVLTRSFGPDEPEVAWSPDSLRVLTVNEALRSAATVVRLWDVPDGRLVAGTRRFRVAGGEVRAAFSVDGRRVLVHDGTALHTLDPTTLRPLVPPVTAAVDSGAMVPHPDGSVLLPHRYLGSLLRVRPGEEVGPPALVGLAGDDVGGVVSPDGSRMAVAGPDRQVRLLDLTTYDFLDDGGDRQWGPAAYAPDGSQYAVAAQGRLRLWDGRSGDYLASLPLPGLTADYALTYRPDSRAVVVASTDGQTWVADTRVDGWVGRACAVAGRNLTREEWESAFPSAEYSRTCPQWPAGT